jgi:hypothetical protein
MERDGGSVERDMERFKMKSSGIVGMRGIDC